MNFDEHFDTISRDVTSSIHDGQTLHKITISKVLKAHAPQVVWEACTQSDKLAQCFTPVSGDLHLGGRFQVKDNAEGTVEKCDPVARQFRVTWEFGGGVSWVEFKVGDHLEGGTTVELAHIAPVSDHWKQYGPGAAGVGWDMAFVGLAAYFSGVKLSEDWYASEQAKAFLTRCSEAWGEAAIRGGDDPEWARTAAKQTTDFYVPKDA